jgi:hypothetical protein
MLAPPRRSDRITTFRQYSDEMDIAASHVRELVPGTEWVDLRRDANALWAVAAINQNPALNSEGTTMDGGVELTLAKKHLRTARQAVLDCFAESDSAAP